MCIIKYKYHFLSINCICVAGETDPWAKDDGSRKVEVSHELQWGGKGGRSASIKVKGQRDGLHGHHHLRAWTQPKQSVSDI